MRRPWTLHTTPFDFSCFEAGRKKERRSNLFGERSKRGVRKEGIAEKVCERREEIEERKYVVRQKCRIVMEAAKKMKKLWF